MDADFAAGKFYVILGDNGAGKTTLLRALAGLAHPTRGTISILGKSPHEACRELGYMAHPSLLYDEMSGMENLRYFARLYDISGDERCEQAIRSVRLDPGVIASRGAVFARHAAAHVAGAGDSARSENSVARRAVFQRRCAFGARNGGLLKAMRDAGKTIFVVTHQARCWKVWPTNSSGCSPDRSWSALPTLCGGPGAQ